MMRLKMSYVCLLCVATFLSSFSAHAQSSNQQQTLNQYIADLQKNPNDYALREKIVKLVQTMTPKPAIPEEAERYMARGAAAVKGAKTEKDFQDAALEFEKASLVAPWLPAAYYNLGITQDKAGKYGEAIQSLKLYLLAAPGASDAKAVKNLVYEIEYKQEKVAKEPSPQAVAVREQNKFEEWQKKLDGARYKFYFSSKIETGYRILDIHGNQIVKGLIITWSKFFPEKTGVYIGDVSTLFNSREFIITSGKYECRDGVKEVMKGRISDDGNSITAEDSCNNVYIYRRER